MLSAASVDGGITDETKSHRVSGMSTPEFIQLLTGSQSRIYAYIYSLVFDADQADDILQQTNAVLWEKSSEFEIGTNFVAWSFRIAYFQVLAHRKKQQRDRLVFDDTLLGSIASAASESDAAFESKQRQLRKCLDKLSQRQRECVQRRYDAGANLDAIAADMNLKSNAVKQLLYRARNALHRCVHSDMPKEAAT